MSTPVLALAVTAVSAPIISISALPPSSNESASSDTTTRSYPLSAAAPFNLLLLAPIFALISLGLGVLAGMLLYRRFSSRRRSTKAAAYNGEYTTGGRVLRAGEDGGFVVGNVSEGDSQTPTTEKPGPSRRGKSKGGPSAGNLPVYGQQEQDSDTWDATDIKTPLLGSTVFASSSSSHTSLHAVDMRSPAMIDTHSAALWLAATRANSVAGISRPVARMMTEEGEYVETPLFEDGMCVPEPPFDYEVSMLYESQEREGFSIESTGRCM